MEKKSVRNLKRKLEPIKDEEVNSPKLIKTEKKLKQPSTSRDDYEDLTILNKKPKLENNIHEPQWTEVELVAEQTGLTNHITENIIELFDEGNTIPFIARYRRGVTNNMSPEGLRDVLEIYKEVSTLKTKISTVLKSLEKSKEINTKLKHSITASRSLEELEYVYAPYKPEGKRTLAARAKDLGLEEISLNLLNNTIKCNLNDYVNKSKKELSTIKEVEKGIVHIIASVIATDTELLSFLRDLRNKTNFSIKTKKATPKEKVKVKTEQKPVDESKFENYSDFEIPIKYIKPHQVLAINRGEALKVLSVKIVIPDNIPQNFNSYSDKKWVNKGLYSDVRNAILKQAIDDSYSRLVQPLIIREIRAELKQKAERASCEVFSTNLKHLLLAPPLKGQPILAIDPGFKHGCKLALVSSMGALLDSCVIYPHKYNSQQKDANIIKKMLLEHNSNLIALGNGTSCRQVEEWLTNLIQNKFFDPIDVKYTIVNEDGASIYSCSPEAKKEFPTLDPNIISAVSLARRVQEPLAELVKVEPKHLGVGMYQHDIKKKSLDDALNDVVSECVSFVGVDLNTTSQCLLSHVAGMTEKRAQQVIQYRDSNGPFVCRAQIKDVTGIGAKVFQQCAGFLRVGPITTQVATTFYKNPKTTKLDRTYIHPESYKITTSILSKLKLKSADIGEPHFIEALTKALPLLNPTQLSTELGTNQDTIQLILDTLSKPLNHDLRNDCKQETLFKKGLTNIDDIKPGDVLSGRISNVTHFGCFVDIGVGCNGLIHVSKYNGLNLQIGDRVEVKIVSVEIAKKRIGLQALKKL